MKTVEFKPVKGYTVINDDFGSGSFGKTILIKDESIDELFVCKKYQPQEGIDSKDFFETFKKEIKLMYQINHPNVVRVFTYYLYEDMFTGYIIMEYVDGATIDEWFDNYLINEATTNDIFRQLIEGFACLEAKGIVHRDIRESNILISNNDEVKIIDLGLGKKIEAEGMSVDSFNSIINRAQMNMFPDEFAEGKYTSKTDMFCIAELFNRMISKENVLDDFKYRIVLEKMMSKNPDDRYDSFADILTAMDKNDFSQLNITNYDRRVYSGFINPLVNSISAFTDVPKINITVEQLLNGLDELLKDNCLNTFVCNSKDLITIVVKSHYKYYPESKIEVEKIESFYKWLIDKDLEFQNIVLRNIVHRLKNIKVEYSDYDDLPF